VTPGYLHLLRRLDGLRSLGVELGLDRIEAVLARLGAPQHRLPAVQVAGTNGKGSTAAMAESILRAAGVRTGLYTSPHLCRFTERFQVAGVEVEGDRLAALEGRVAQAVAQAGVRLTYFEVATVLAFLLFADEKVELAVLETGLGGRLDAVTTCRPVATAVTSIALEHTDYLGGTLREIAREKAGIIKAGVPHYIGPLPAEADEEMMRTCAALEAPLFRVAASADRAPIFQVPLALGGQHQQTNAALARALAWAAASHLGRPLADAVIEAGLASVRWPGRMERVAPDVLLDCAHNPEAARALAAALPPRDVQFDPAEGKALRALVLAMVRGKDVAGVVEALLPCVDLVIATQSHNPRSVPAEELVALVAACRTNTPCVAVPAPMRAVAEARFRAHEVVVAGSIFLVGEVRAALLGQSDACDPQPVSDPL
jgi:dihydrofolate synthase/folylpolyglutamate synthase